MEKSVNHIYFIGICGTAMGNVAIMLKEMGYQISGADTGIYPPMSTRLDESGITMYEGYSAERLRALAPDLVVVGNAVSRGNEEVEWLLNERNVPYTSLAALLNQFVLSKRKNIVVTGTHGKTTTTTLTAYLLRAAGTKPGYMIGGVPRDLPGGSNGGEEGGSFVIEGDEYDTAFFDKRSKFIHYSPDTVIVNNIEFDHADIFRDLTDILRTFSHLFRIVPGNGRIIYNADDKNIASLLPVPWTNTYSVGLSKESDLRISDFQESAEGVTFNLYFRGDFWTGVNWKVYGLYNARNAAMAALASALTCSPENPTAFKLDALSDFKGVKRRQEKLVDQADLVVIEDFGHHPTAIGETIRSLRNRYPGWYISACFEPRSNTACTNVLQEQFTKALGQADAVYLAPVFRSEKYAPETRLDTELMISMLNRIEVNGRAFDSNQTLESTLLHDIQRRKRPTVVIFFSNGAFGGVIGRIAQTLS